MESNKEKKEEVYVLFIEVVYNGVVLTRDIDVFDSFKKAKDTWTCFVCEETRSLTEECPDFIISTDDEEQGEFKAFIKGDYNNNHTIAQIYKKEVM